MTLLYYGIAAVALGYLWFRGNTIPTGPAFIMFYSPRCVYCHEALPEFTRLGSTTKVNDKVIQNVRINVDKQKELAVKFEVQGLPTFIYTDGTGRVVKYEGDRKADAFKAFLGQQV